MAQKKKLPPKVKGAKAAAGKAVPAKLVARAPSKSKPAVVRAAASKAKTKTATTKAGNKHMAAKVVPASKSAAINVTLKKPAAPKAVPAKAAPVKAGAAKPVAAKPVADVKVLRPVATLAKPVVARAVPAAVAKPAAQKISAPVTPKDIAQKAAEAARLQAQASALNKKPVNQRHGFKTNEFIVYPAHGVGRIVGIEEQEIAGMSLELFVITFDKDKMTLRVPTGKLQSVGMRKLSDEDVVKKAMETLKGRARIKRTMWSRRAQEYEAKINSGDLVSIAEVVRDLYRSESQPEQSYSERQLYEAALDRMAREIAAVDKLDERGAVQRITEVLSRSARGRRVSAEGGENAPAEVKAA
jgi:CarD family transcriptional regulator